MNDAVVNEEEQKVKRLKTGQAECIHPDNRGTWNGNYNPGQLSGDNNKHLFSLMKLSKNIGNQMKSQADLCFSSKLKVYGVRWVK
jgi:hypothetical protein